MQALSLQKTENKMTNAESHCHQLNSEIDIFSNFSEIIHDLQKALVFLSVSNVWTETIFISIVGKINKLFQQNSDICIAYMHLSFINNVPCKPSLIHAMVVNIIGNELKWSQDRIFKSTIAALMANNAYIPYQEYLNSLEEKLDEKQREALMMHPMLSKTTCLRSGIIDDLILTIIEQHHENDDGSGYPHGIKGDSILIEAKVLALAERYTAILSRRAYRDGMTTIKAKEILINSKIDSDIINAFFNAIGEYPPGTFVRLKNNEIAVVTKRTQKPNCPQVFSVENNMGVPFRIPKERNCNENEYKIARAETINLVTDINYYLMWQQSNQCI